MSGTRKNAPKVSLRRYELIVAFKAATTSALAREILDRAEAAAAGDNCYLALEINAPHYQPRRFSTGPIGPGTGTIRADRRVANLGEDQ